MPKIIYKLLITVCAMILFSSAAYASEGKSRHFGPGADMDKLVAIADVMAQPDSYLQRDITVKGKVNSVCTKKGCWMTLVSEAQQLRIKVDDGDMVFPVSARGKTAFATGKLEALHLSKAKAIAYLSHLAEDAGESFDKTSIKGDTTVYQFRPVGVSINP